MNPVGFTDHHFVHLNISKGLSPTCSLTTSSCRTPHFASTFTACGKDGNFRKQTSVLWSYSGRLVRHRFVYCQQCTSHSTAKIKATIQELEASIKSMEEEFQIQLKVICWRRRGWRWAPSCRREWRGLCQLKDMDAPTSFFFDLERSVAQRKQMTCLELPGGRLTTGPDEMRSHAMHFCTVGKSNTAWKAMRSS